MTRIVRPAVERIDAQIEALERERLRLLTQPEDCYQNGDVLWFTKQFGGEGTIYTYAVIKVAPGRWYITQGGSVHGHHHMSWDRLLEFIGDGELWAATEWERVQ